MKTANIYDYKNANGNLVSQTLRFDPKGFCQRRPHDNGFIWGLKEGWYEHHDNSNDFYLIKDCEHNSNKPPHENAVWFDKLEPPLYNLPDVCEAISKNETVFIVEGEKDADNLTNLGFASTTSSMGAGKWQSAHTGCLKSSNRVVILPDKDQQGLKHAAQVAEELYSQGIEVKLLELPNLNGTAIKDISDWIEAGGTELELRELVENCSIWKPSNLPQNDNDHSSVDLVKKYGEPYYYSSKGTLNGINQAYWAGLYDREHIQIYEPQERDFYQYDDLMGLWRNISTDIIKKEISQRMLEVSRDLEDDDRDGLERKRTDSTLNNIVGQLKGICEKKDAFNKVEKKIVHLANGVLEFNSNDEANLVNFSHEFYSRNQSPIPFDESAPCPRFLNELIYPSVTSDDAILLQKYAGLCLLGNNLIQRFLILDGKAGRGKSTLALIIQKLIGLNNVTQLRTRLLSERFETYRFIKKTLLVGVDVSGNFLNEKGASVIKGLVGGDIQDAEKKSNPDNFQFQGDFCMLITSNSRLHVRLDSDVGAWRRRLLIVRFEGPPPSKKIPHFDNVLIQQEGSGILNWALHGLAMLLDDIKKYDGIYLTEQQSGVVDALLAESDSLRHFLKDCVVKDQCNDLSVPEIEEAYAEYCTKKGWNPKSRTDFLKELTDLMLRLYTTSKAHSIKRAGKDTKGFRRVSLKNRHLFEQEWD